jgi:renalase
MKFGIIGAGMAGLACADALTDAGHAVALFDKGRGAGGRMSTRRLATPVGEVSFDHGAQYFTARDPSFVRLVGSWRDLGIAAPWPPAGKDAWIGVPGMNAVIKLMASAHSVTWGCLVTSMVRRDGQWWLADKEGETGPFDGVIVALPAEQAATILSLHDFQMARSALFARSQPCWTGMFVFECPLEGLPPILRQSGNIAWAACNSAKPGRSGPEAWVVQASASWSSDWLEASQEEVTASLHAALADAAGNEIPNPIAASSHRWRYALSAGTGEGAMWNRGIGLGVCGDWLLGPRVECAWLSGRMLAKRCLGPGQAAEPANVSAAELI